MPTSEPRSLLSLGEAEPFNPFAVIHPGNSSRLDEQDWSNTQALLGLIMPVLQTVIWEAWLESVELISLRFGQNGKPVFDLDPAQIRPGAPWLENVYPGDRERLRAFLQKPSPAGVFPSVDYRLIVGQGELLWVRQWNLGRSVEENQRTRLRGMIRAIAEEKRLEWECLRISERECNRIGQELHDDLGQVLAGISILTRVLAQRAAKHSAELSVGISDLNLQVVSATERVRSMAHGLFPAQLKYATLRHALREFVRQTQIRVPVRLTLKLQPKLPPHTPEQIIHLYRIVQEAVNNSIRHGNATRITIMATATPGTARVCVVDNGSGFPLGAARGEGIGLHVMNFRAHELGGSFHSRNRPPEGAMVEVVYPIAAIPRRPRNRKKATVRGM